MNPLVTQTYSPSVLNFDVIPRKISSQKQDYNEFHFRERYVTAVQQVANKLSKDTISDGRYFKFQFSEPRFDLKPMNSWYSDETVSYFTEKGLEDIQVYVINGLIYNKDLNLYNSTVNLNEDFGDGEMIVMDRLGNMFIAPKERGIFHHSSFFSGKPVAFAALCYIDKGNIKNLVRYSGHYSPGEKEENSFSQQLSTIYLVEEQAFAALKIDDKGSLVQTINVSSKQKVLDLYDSISEIGDFCKPRLRLISNGKSIATSRGPNLKDIITIADSTLKSGSIIHALEFQSTPMYRTFPVSKFELLITD